MPKSSHITYNHIPNFPLQQRNSPIVSTVHPAPTSAPVPTSFPAPPPTAYTPGPTSPRVSARWGHLVSWRGADEHTSGRPHCQCCYCTQPA